MIIEKLALGQKVEFHDGQIGYIQQIDKEHGDIWVEGKMYGCQHVKNILEVSSIMDDCKSLGEALTKYYKTEHESDELWKDFIKKHPCYA